MHLLPLAALALASFCTAQQTFATDSSIHITPGQVINHMTPWMYGSCIGDVNHEIYGGLYSQRISYGGYWRIEKGALMVTAEAGAKLVRQKPVGSDGSVACDIRFADTKGENAGLITSVSDPHIGADRWTGYEISLNIRDKTLILGRHRNNWELLRAVPTPIEAGRWYRLRVDQAGGRLRVFLDDAPTPLLEYTEGADALPGRQIGLHTWNSNASFHNLTLITAGQDASEPLDGTQPGGNSVAVSGMWDAIATGGVMSRYVWDSDNPYNTAHSQQLTYLSGTGTVGIANRGLMRWGIAVRKNQPLTGHFHLRQSDYTGRVTVALPRIGPCPVGALQSVAPIGGEWTRRDFTLHPDTIDPNARFAIWIDRPGTLWVDQVFLSETGKAQFHGLPLRADIGDKLVAGGLTFLRYGGSMVNAAEYRWKKMIGDRDKRPQYRGWWYPSTSNGFGIEEFLQFCEAAHIEPAFAINIEETPEDAADLVEYLNGPITSVWGAKRAANGHPQPYKARCIEIGNEEAMGGNRAEYAHYLERFKQLYAAMRPRDPNINYVIAAWWRPDEPLCKEIALQLNGKAALWDVHVDADNLRDADTADRTLTQMQRLFGEWIPASSMRACIFEENGDRHDLQRALGHARLLNVTQRHGNFVRMDCPANCLQPFGQNDNGWNQGQVFFTPDKVWAMPPYYVQQMAAANHLPLCVACAVVSPNHDLDVTATRSENGKTLVLKVVNSSANPHKADLNVGDFMPASAPADVWTLNGDLHAVNTVEAPERVSAVRSRLDIPGAQFAYTFPPYSYTILRLQKL